MIRVTLPPPLWGRAGWGVPKNKLVAEKNGSLPPETRIGRLIRHSYWDALALPVADLFSSTHVSEVCPNSFIKIGFFESKGFDKSSSETISVTFIKQAKQEGYNPLSVLDSIKKLDTVALNSLITEIINFNRYKTSYLGSKSNLFPFEPVARNIVA